MDGNAEQLEILSEAIGSTIGGPAVQATTQLYVFSISLCVFLFLLFANSSLLRHITKHFLRWGKFRHGWKLKRWGQCLKGLFCLWPCKASDFRSKRHCAHCSLHKATFATSEPKSFLPLIGWGCVGKHLCISDSALRGSTTACSYFHDQRSWGGECS